MSERDDAAYRTLIEERRDRFAIDPFGAVPDDASRIGGLGGSSAAFEPGYVFRTVPVEPPAGAAAFLIELRDLIADGGTISVELSATHDRPDAVPLRLATIVRPLQLLVVEGGSLVVGFEAHRGHRYAVAGYSHGDLAIQASAVTIELVTGADAVAIPTPVERRSPDDLTIEPVPIPRLRAIEAPGFRDPLSQPMTAGQRRHADYRDWVARLGLNDRSDPQAAWAEAFVLQSFTRFGALKPGTRAFGVNVGNQAVPAMLASLGCEVVCATHAERGETFDATAALSRMQRPAICAAGRFAAAVSCVGEDLHHPEMARGDRDIAWCRHVAGPGRFEDIFWLAMHRLNPGGLCVYVFDFDPEGEGNGIVPGRARVERLALNALSFGHDIVQLVFRRPAEDVRQRLRQVPFGLIARRT